MLSKFANHEKEGGCARRVVPCKACRDFCFADELKRHEVWHGGGGSCCGVVARSRVEYEKRLRRQAASNLALVGGGQSGGGEAILDIHAWP